MSALVSSRVSSLLLISIVQVVGCSSFAGFPGVGGWGDSPRSGSAFSVNRKTSANLLVPGTASGKGVQIVYLVFDILRADFVIDEVQHSRKVWNHVDELRMDPGVTSRLARNGFRVGVSSEDAWPILRAIFDAAEASIDRQELVAQGSVAMTIPMASIEPDESIFSYGSDGRLVGRTFRGGTKLINVDYLFRPELGGLTELRLSFEVRREGDELTWQKRGSVIEQRPTLDRYLFDELEASVTLRSKEFLVIGLTDFKQNEYLVGSRFLSFRRSGVRHERLLFITPRAVGAMGLGRVKR